MGLCLPTCCTVDNVAGYACPIKVSEIHSEFDIDVSTHGKINLSGLPKTQPFSNRPSVGSGNGSFISYPGCGVTPTSNVGSTTTAAVMRRNSTGTQISEVQLVEDNEKVLKRGAMVKITAGCHLDGHIAQSTLTVVCGEKRVTGRKADIVLAAWQAAEAAARLARVGAHSNDVIGVICKMAKFYKCTPVEGTVLRQVLRNKMAGNKTVAITYDYGLIYDSCAADDITYETVIGSIGRSTGFEFAPNEVYVVTVTMSTGVALTRSNAPRPTVFHATDRLTSMTEKEFLLLPRSIQALLSKLDALCRKAGHAPLLSWTANALSGAGRFWFTLNELEEEFGHQVIDIALRRRLISGCEVVQEEDEEHIAQFTFTLVMTSKGQKRVTSLPISLNALILSEFKLPDGYLLDVLSLPLDAPERSSGPVMKIRSIRSMDSQKHSDFQAQESSAA